MQDIVNEFNEDLVYTLSDDNGVVLEERKLPNTADKTYLKVNINIESKKIKTYSLKVTFKNSDKDQNDLQGLSFKATLGVDTNNKNIYKVEDLVQMDIDVENDITYKDYNILLMNDIDFNEDSSYRNPNSTEFGDINNDGAVESIKKEVTTKSGLRPIGNYSKSKPFEGTFDGQNHSIENMHIFNDSFAGLFDYVNGATLKNINLSGSIGSTKDASAALVVNLTGESKIMNITNYTNVSSYGPAEGIADIMREGTTTFDNCKNYGTIVSETSHAGGVTGGTWSNVFIYNSSNYGDVTGLTSAAGIARYVNPKGKLVIKNAYNEGTIKTTSPEWGRIAGIATAITGETEIYDSKNIGLIQGMAANAGGIAGAVTAKLTVKNCSNTGKIDGLAGSYGHTGGIVGEVTADLIVENCENRGEITSATAAGGVIGRVTKNSSVKNCKNYGNVHSYQSGTYFSLGGIIGEVYTGSIKTLVENCENYGKIYDGKLNGGVVGSVVSSELTIVNSLNAGEIISTGFAGGIFGQLYLSLDKKDATLYVYNSFNTGNITSNGYSMAGILGKSNDGPYNNITLNNVYNYGILKATNMEDTAISQVGACSNGARSVNISNSYYRSNGAKGTNCISPDPTISKTTNEIASSSFADTLNNNISSLPNTYTYKTWKSNGTYPVFNE